MRLQLAEDIHRIPIRGQRGSFSKTPDYTLFKSRAKTDDGRVFEIGARETDKGILEEIFFAEVFPREKEVAAKIHVMSFSPHIIADQTTLRVDSLYKSDTVNSQIESLSFQLGDASTGKVNVFNGTTLTAHTTLEELTKIYKDEYQVAKFALQEMYMKAKQEQQQPAAAR